MSMITIEEEKALIERIRENVNLKYEPAKEPFTKEHLTRLCHELEQYPSAVAAACVEKGRRADAYISRKDKYYTDASLHCTNHKIGARCGFAVTMRVGVPVPGFEPPTRADLLRLIDASPKPVTLVIQVDEPEGMKLADSNFGGQFGRICHTCGVQNVICDGAIRDLDELEAMGMQLMIPGSVASTAPSVIYELNGRVTVAGMTVEPGEVVHMDRDGAVKFHVKDLEKLTVMCKAEKELEEWTDAVIEQAETLEECIHAFEISNYKSQLNEKMSFEHKENNEFGAYRS